MFACRELNGQGSLSGSNRDRTDDLLIFSQARYRLRYRAECLTRSRLASCLVGQPGFEPEIQD